MAHDDGWHAVLVENGEATQVWHHDGCPVDSVGHACLLAYEVEHCGWDFMADDFADPEGGMRDGMYAVLIEWTGGGPDDPDFDYHVERVVRAVRHLTA